MVILNKLVVVVVILKRHNHAATDKSPQGINREDDL